MDKKLALVQDLKRVASELGKIPTRQEYIKFGHTGYSYETLFSTWTDAIVAVFGSFEYKSNARKKDSKQYTPLEPVLKYYEENQKSFHFEMTGPIVIIGDTHFPFADSDTLTFVYSVIESIKPHFVVQIGDLKDQYAQAKFPRSHNTYSPKEEEELGTKMAAEMWSNVQKIVPEAKCLQLLGNHDSRPYKRMMELSPTLEHLFDFKKYMTFENVLLIEDPREELTIGEVLFTHGWLSQLGAHRDYFMKSTCVGHSHRGGVSFRNIGSRIIFELNAGLTGNPFSKALSYTPTRSTNWTLGLGAIDDLGPRFIPKP